MRRSRRADADTPRDTPGNVEATRAAANAASSEEDSSNLSALDKEPVRVTTGFNNMDSHCYPPRSRIHFPLDHAPGEDMLLTNRKVGRSVMDDEAGSVSSEITDACSEITDVSLETSASPLLAPNPSGTPCVGRCQ